jgi:anti-sigma factor RsiW
MRSAQARIETLLVAEATGTLSKAESAELEALLASHPDVDRYAFQRTAAAVFLVAADPSAAMPGHLRARIVADVER